MNADTETRYFYLGKLAAELRLRGWQAERGASATGVPLVYIPDPAGGTRSETVCCAYRPDADAFWLFWGFGPAIAAAEDTNTAAGIVTSVLQRHVAAAAAFG